MPATVKELSFSEKLSIASTFREIWSLIAKEESCEPASNPEVYEKAFAAISTAEQAMQLWPEFERNGSDLEKRTFAKALELCATKEEVIDEIVTCFLPMDPDDLLQEIWHVELIIQRIKELPSRDT